MALNSMIRKIPLLGNCDLTNFHADIHDYEGFENDNSLFLNKRKVNWWKREADDSEFSGLHAFINGDYFDIYKGTSKLGQISRSYYKLETVSATEHRGQNLLKCENPYPQGKNWELVYKKGNLLINGTPFDYNIRECGNYTLVWNKSEHKVYIYDTNGDSVNEGWTPIVYDYDGSMSSAEYVDFYYAEDAAYEINIKGVIITIPQGQVYICAKNGAAGGGYLLNLETKEFGFVTITNSTTGVFVDGQNIAAHGAFGHLYHESSRVYEGMDLNYSIAVINGIIYVVYYHVYELPLVNDADFEITKQGTVIESEHFSIVSIDYKKCTSYVTDFDVSSYPCTAMLRMTFDGDIKKSVEFESTNTYQIFNYSKKYGKWAVNFVENTAQNIAHDYKKLFELDGNEEEGVLTDIDGYNDDYIYFHFAENYYRISIATTENIHDVVKTFNGIYVLFNTTSYLNAIYLNSNTWFCSCDDWNDRLLWLQTSNEYESMDSSSRLNDKWQVADNVESVSTQYYLLKRNLPVTCVRVTAFQDSATWDGSQYVYDVNCNRINTDSWEIGQSLAGYYKGVEYNSVPTKITPFYIDSNYTCPVYEDQDGNTQNQSYTVYFQKVLEIDVAQSAVKQGMISASGFTVSLDEGDIYASPESSYQQQETPCLLDAEYIIYDTSVLVITSRSSYQLMRNSQLGLWFFVYLTTTETPISAGDSVFVINGVEYVYKTESEQIQDYTGAWVANTNMLLYIGFTSSRAFFYSKFDKNIYAFKGDNTFEKVISLERFPLSYSSNGQPQTLYMSSIDVLFVNLITAVLVMYDNQYILLDTGVVNSWELDYNTSCLKVNNILYSLVKSTLEENNTQSFEISAVPIKIATQLYGDPTNETNMINDCLYLTVDNLQGLYRGSVKLQAEGLSNGKVIKGDEKTLIFKNEDFNELSQLLIKFQPKIQEAKGVRFYIESDFEISEMKIGTSAGAMNQTTKRI